MKSGELVSANLAFSKFIRIYSDENCSQWKDQLKDQIGLVLGHHKNKFGLKVIKLLLPQGIFWTYDSDVTPI